MCQLGNVAISQLVNVSIGQRGDKLLTKFKNQIQIQVVEVSLVVGFRLSVLSVQN